MSKFRKKPVVIDAFQWTGENPFQLGEWTTDVGADRRKLNINDDGTLTVTTAEGPLVAKPGHWVVRGANGDMWPVSAEYFAGAYETDDAVVPRSEVGAFARLMEARLRENDHKTPTWKEMDAGTLWRLMEAKVDRLGGTPDGDGDSAEAERIATGRGCADIANYAMMIADVSGSLTRPLAPAEMDTPPSLA